MGEIKSTLDMVLEKTRHLTLSKAEKKEQQQVDFQKRINGLLEKYQDNLLTRQDFKKELDGLIESLGLPHKALLTKAILNRIALHKDNEPYFILLKDSCGLNSDHLRSLISEYQSTIEEAARHGAIKTKKRLKKDYGLSGSAVIPNLFIDPDWIKEQNRISHQFNQTIDREKERLTAEA